MLHFFDEILEGGTEKVSNEKYEITSLNETIFFSMIIIIIIIAKFHINETNILSCN